MVIQIKAYQKQGKNTNELIDEFEFCCWKHLQMWLDGFELYRCKDFEDIKEKTKILKKEILKVSKERRMLLRVQKRLKIKLDELKEGTATKY